MSRAEEWFLKIEGVPGASAGWTPIQSAGALVCVPSGSTNGSSSEFSCEVRKTFDCTSPWLLQTCGSGETNRRVTLTCKLTQPGAMLHRIILDNARVASVCQKGGSSPGTAQLEVVRFTFEKIEMACLDLAANGGISGGLTAVFDQTTGEGILKSRPPFQVAIDHQKRGQGVVVTWPAERGHRYRILSRVALSETWNTLAESTAAEDGPLSEYLPAATPAMFMRLEEVD
jgi:type VI protein secretion system component Hcp